MKNINLILGTATLMLMAGCTSTPIALAPVGPNPAAPVVAGSKGQLLVFSAWQGHGEGNNPVYYQHADYDIYDLQGKLVRHVDNTVGHYEQKPRLISLPPGKYTLRSPTKGFGNLRVTVPLVIRRGEITRVHLDDDWKLPAGAPAAELVSGPNSYPVGWRADDLHGER